MERAAFSVRNFSVELRQEIVAEAERNRLSVGEFLEAICLAAKAAGWTRAALDDADLPVSRAYDRVSHGQLIEIAQNAALPKWLRDGAAVRLGLAIGVEKPPPRPRPARLNAPNGAAQHGQESAN